MESNNEIVVEKEQELEEHVIGSTSWGDYCYSLAFFISTLALRPKVAVELGVYEGFASYQIGSALMCLNSGKLYSYDLWEDYEFTHCKKSVAEKNLAAMSNHVELRQKNAMEAHNDFEDNSVDMLVVDISNDGDTYINCLYNWYPKLTDKALILFEGGTAERDVVPWMLKYEKKPILQALRQNEFILSHYNYGITEVFPGMTILVKKD